MDTHIIYFVHGTTNDNLNGISSGWYDAELSPLGIQQGIDLKDQIKDKHIDVVFCSDLQRAYNSAKLTFEDSVPIIPDQRLRECNYGIYNAGPSSVVEPMQEKNITERFPEGESYEDVKERIISLLKDVQRDYPGKNVAFVAHKAPQLSLDVIIKHKTREQAFAEDRRKTKSWKPGWEYVLSENFL